MTEPFKMILVATDFSEPAGLAVERAIDLAARYGASLRVVHAWDFPPIAYAAMGQMMVDVLPFEQAARTQLDALVKALGERGVAVESTLCQGVAWDQIVSLAKQVGADLIVVGSHGRTGVKRAVLGSVAERVVRHATVPVLTVHGPPSLDPVAP